MAGIKTETTEIIKKYLEKYPDMPNRTMARMIYGQHGHLFKSVENVRSNVRTCRGRNGVHDRQYTADKRFYLPEPTQGNPYSLPKQHNLSYADYIIPADLKRGLIFADTQIPFQDNKVLNIVFERGKKHNPDYIVLNGDIIDFYRESKFLIDPTIAQTKQSIEDTIQFLTSLRTIFPDALIILKLGNHDDRWYRYMMDKAPEFYGIPEFRIENVLHTDTLGIEVVGDKRRIRAGKLYIVHGHEFWQSIQNPVNPARGLYLKAKRSAICGHFHQTSEHSEPDIGDQLVTCWSIGCCCQLHPQYMPINKWNHGFALMEKQTNGNFQLDNLRVIDYEIV